MAGTVGAGAGERTHSGWVTFAGVVFAIAGCGNLIWGLGALAKKSYLPENGLLFSTLGTWGWIAILWGIVVILGAVLLLARAPSGPALGIVLAAVSAVFWLFVLPVLPMFALAALILDVLVIYGLVAHGSGEGN
ncbi:MAG: hypothetical protein U0U69_14735 [Acidimicrobiia bacterium]